jgi:hypothetical protein
MLMDARKTTDKTETRYLIFMTGLLCNGLNWFWSIRQGRGGKSSRRFEKRIYWGIFEI